MRTILTAIAFIFMAQSVAAETLQLQPEEKRRNFPDLQLYEVNHQVLNLSQFRGSPVLLSFWASWCSACLRELPQLQRLYDKYNGEGLVVLTVYTDGSSATPLQKLVEMDISLPSYQTSIEALRQARVGDIPATFLLDADGKLVRGQVGYSEEFESRFGGLVEQLLAEIKSLRRVPVKALTSP